MRHEPVMLAEVLESLALKPGMVVVDGTIGLGGHAIEMAKRIAPGGTLIGFDWDSEMLKEAELKLRESDGVDIQLHHADYRRIPEMIFPGRANAILLDLGLNTAQIEDPSRGISFRAEGPLDMRMDRSRGESAASLLNRASVGEIERILKEYGDENWARRIAQVIVDRRKAKPLKTTSDLVECVLAAIPPAMRDKRIDPATRTFQAVRIAVNQELEGLEECIRDIAECLEVDGVMAVLSYHSGEDRAAKNAFRSLRGPGFEELDRRPRTPSNAEIARNPKARSAKLRAIRRVS